MGKFIKVIISRQAFFPDHGVKIQASGMERTTLGNSPAYVHWMDHLSKAQTSFALGKRIQPDDSGNGPQHLNNYKPTDVQPPINFKLTSKITDFVIALIEDNVGEGTEEEMRSWGYWWSGKPWKRIIEDFGFPQAKKLAKEMRGLLSPLRAVLVAIQYNVAMGLATTLIQ